VKSVVRWPNRGSDITKGDQEEITAEQKRVVSVLLIDPLSKITRNTKVLLVTRNNGKKTNVSGYTDVVSDPTGQLKDSDFNIINYTAAAELREECGLSQCFTIRPGGRFVETNGDVTSHIFTVGAIYTGGTPRPVPDGEEILDCEWVPLSSVRHVSNLSSGYLKNTLSHSLMAYGLRLNQSRRLIG
jgi:hypothetical protein